MNYKNSSSLKKIKSEQILSSWYAFKMKKLYLKRFHWEWIGVMTLRKELKLFMLWWF